MVAGLYGEEEELFSNCYDESQMALDDEGRKEGGGDLGRGWKVSEAGKARVLEVAGTGGTWWLGKQQSQRFAAPPMR
jgi:hypothetical protein